MSNKRDLTRAEIVRQRRNERAAKEITQTAQQAIKPMTRVTSRTPTIPVNYQNTKQRTQKMRKFNLSLGLPELHLPKPNWKINWKPKFSMPRLQNKWRITSMVFALLLATSIYLVFTLPYFYVPQATVLGNNRITREEINSVLNVTGQSIFIIRPDEIRTQLLSNYPDLISADVKVYLPNHVYVTVVERTPVLLWQQNNGYTWIDSNGIAFRPRGVAENLILVNAIDTPPAGMIDENNLTPYMQKELVDAITLLSPLVPVGSTLNFSLADGLHWQDPRGWTVAFGTSSNDMPLKIRVYQSLVDSLTAQRKTPIYINVVHPEGPFYRMAEVIDEE